MSTIQRICAQCGQPNPVESRFCAHCGYDAQSALPAPQSSLPVVVGRAAVPVLLGVASLALRAGWKLLQSRSAQQAARRAVQTVMNRPAPAAPLAPRPEAAPAPRPRRTIRIRSQWAVGDARGVWQQGMSEHTIELDE
jgi:hypothetical protein